MLTIRPQGSWTVLARSAPSTAASPGAVTPASPPAAVGSLPVAAGSALIVPSAIGGPVAGFVDFSLSLRSQKGFVRLTRRANAAGSVVAFGSDSASVDCGAVGGVGGGSGGDADGGCTDGAPA